MVRPHNIFVKIRYLGNERLVSVLRSRRGMRRRQLLATHRLRGAFLGALLAVRIGAVVALFRQCQKLLDRMRRARACREQTSQKSVMRGERIKSNTARYTHSMRIPISIKHSSNYLCQRCIHIAHSFLCSVFSIANIFATLLSRGTVCQTRR